MNICGMPAQEFLITIESFHGFRAPGMLIGGLMVDLAQQLLGPDVEADAVAESRHCLPDAVQLFTPCTIGNGWLKIVDWDKFAISLYDRHTLAGHRVWVDIEKLKLFPDLYNWFMRLVPKKSLPLEVLQDAILEARHAILSHCPITMQNLYQRQKKSATNICTGCNEAYSADQGDTCLACQGGAYYIRVS